MKAENEGKNNEGKSRRNWGNSILPALQVTKELEMGHHICKQILGKRKTSLEKERAVSKRQVSTIEHCSLCMGQMWDFEWTCNRHPDYFDITLHGQQASPTYAL